MLKKTNSIDDIEKTVRSMWAEKFMKDIGPSVFDVMFPRPPLTRRQKLLLPFKRIWWKITSIRISWQ